MDGFGPCSTDQGSSSGGAAAVALLALDGGSEVSASTIGFGEEEVAWAIRLADSMAVEKLDL